MRKVQELMQGLSEINNRIFGGRPNNSYGLNGTTKIDDEERT